MGFDFTRLAREEIREIPVYSPGLDTDDVRRRYGVDRVIKLASNENPLGPSPVVAEAVKKAASEVHLYPDGYCTALRGRLSGMLGLPPESFVFGNGTDEIIDFIFLAFFSPAERAVMGEPTFSSYFLTGMTVGARIEYVPLRDHRHCVRAMLDAVDGTTKAVFVGTPHNPTGTICTTEDLELFLEGLPRDALLVWDEAYREYVDDPSYPESVPYLKEHPNLIILRTFSKIYGLAGLRVGYGMADPSVVDMLERVRPPFNVNRVAQAAALAALDDRDYLERSRKMNSEGRQYLTRELERLGLTTVPSQANFVLFRFDHVTENLSERLLEQGIIVRDGSTLGYPGCVRMTVGTPGDNREVVGVIERLIQSG